MIVFGLTMQTDDSGLASYAAGQVDRSLSWKVKWSFPNEISWTRNLKLEYQIFYLAYVQDVKWLQTITHLPILLKGVITAEDGK